MASINHELSDVFKEMSVIYKYMGTEERFRSLAYAKAARTIDSMKEDIEELYKSNKLTGIPGIGESIKEKIEEFIQSGKIRKHIELKRKVPVELLELLNVSGFGPETLRLINEKLHIKSKDELTEALQNGKIAALKGIGSKKVERMMRGLKIYKQSEERMPLWNALELSSQIIAEMKECKEIIRIEVAGSIRRRKENIGDIDILISCHPKYRKKIINKFTLLTKRKTVLEKGDTRASIISKDHNIQIDLRIVNEHEWGAALIYFTGSKEHNIHLRTIAKEKGYKMNEYGIFTIKDETKIAGATEEEVYETLGFKWMPPEMRENKGELEIKLNKKLQKLVELKDIRGDLQMHSTWSDGTMDIKALAEFVLKNYAYEYIVLTDHSKSERIAGGMDENKFLKQIRTIASVNKEIGKDFVKAGAEVDILPDGLLDLDDALLSKLDWVCASIHSGFNKDNTERLISACKHPLVNCIGHPSGRLIGKREAYTVNWKKLFEVAATTGTAMEINAQPDRMDLNETLARQAKDAGVKLLINTDSHKNAQFDFMQLGVFIARRAWLVKEDILNTKKWKDIQDYVFTKRKKTKITVYSAAS